MRLCDFTEARPINEDVKEWEGQATIAYTSPKRRFLVTDSAPMVSDDLYAVGLCIWQIHTKRRPYSLDTDEEDIEESLREGKLVDVKEIGDVETQNIVWKYLTQCGARIRDPSC